MFTLFMTMYLVYAQQMKRDHYAIILLALTSEFFLNKCIIFQLKSETQTEHTMNKNCFKLQL